MKTKLHNIFILLALAAMLAGCTALQSEFYPGEQVDNLYKILPAESAWASDDDAVMHFRVVESNSLMIASLEWSNQHGEFRKETMDVVLSKLDDQYFASIKDEDGEQYVIARLILPETDHEHPSSAIILNIDEDKLLSDAKEGKVRLHESERRGKKKFETILTGTKEDQDDYFRRNPNALWDLESASTISRIAVIQGSP
ncbi:PTD012 family protein [Pontiella sulfatireligans]|uniref:Uncharacterized protein n=1 Tax=Pontiella sulfatireligans TaxID=2750658 RepID=A0A6C2UI67_9BACT|nr:PTD012 family protein [Pontiella sulfatireligans]VGO19895.1 hypothetical protein SCARR_01955 [Pontiella sulfatireligans]